MRHRERACRGRGDDVGCPGLRKLADTISAFASALHRLYYNGRKLTPHPVYHSHSAVLAETNKANEANRGFRADARPGGGDCTNRPAASDASIPELDVAQPDDAGNVQRWSDKRAAQDDSHKNHG